jgi:hypothetical protein
MNKCFKKPISICIPRMDNDISKDFIYETFNKLNIGYILSLKEIPLRNDNKHKRVIISLSLNGATEYSNIFNERMNKNESIKIVYDMPWYWKIVPTCPQK